MDLPVPHRLHERFQAAPVDVSREAAIGFQPRCVALRARVRRVRVQPVLESVHGRDPAERRHYVFEVARARAVGILGGVKFFEVRSAQ